MGEGGASCVWGRGVNQGRGGEGLHMWERVGPAAFGNTSARQSGSSSSQSRQSLMQSSLPYAVWLVARLGAHARGGRSGYSEGQSANPE